MNIIAIIPARAGSRGLPGKNTAMIGGKPMFMHSVEAAKGCRYVNEVWVSTNSLAVMRDADGSGAFVHRRSFETAHSGASMADVLREFAAHLGELDRLEPDSALLVLYPTYPNRTSAHLDAIVSDYDGRPLVGLKPTTTHPYLAMKVESGKIQRMIGHDRYRRQDYPECCEITHAACMLPVKLLPEVDDYLLHESTQPFYVPEAWGLVDVDEAADLAEAKRMMGAG